MQTSVVNVHKEMAIYYTLEFEGKKYVSTVFDEKTKESMDGKVDVSIPEVKQEGDVTVCVEYIE